MTKKVWFLAAMLVLTAGAAVAQDARAVLRSASAAMGGENLKSIQYSGTGWIAAVGQSYSPNENYPRFEITSYTRTIDYDAKFSREDLTRRQGNYPARGGGGTPIQGDQRLISLVSGNYAWNVNGQDAVPQPGQYLAGISVAEVRQLDLLLSPHGFLKAAMAENPTAVPMTLGGSKVTIITFTAMGKYRVNGVINSQNLVERVYTRVPNPVFGDMFYEHRYTEYKDFNGVKFPTVLHSHQGDLRLNIGHDWLEVRVTSVQPNASAAVPTVPDAVRQATNPPVRVESQKLANGVWLLAGGSHNSVAVEFRDFVAIVEAPLNEQRSLAVIAEVQKLLPNKPIQYVVNTHQHFDHSGGLRTYVAQGATIITHPDNRQFYDQILFYPAARTLEPDRLSTLYPAINGSRVPQIETMNEKYVLSDGSRTMDIYPVQGLAHSSNMLIAYLPTEKILVNADLYSPPAPGAKPPAVSASMISLRQNIQRLKLDVTQHVPIHGVVGTHADFLKITGASSN